MSEQELLILFVGIIAICMLFITVVIVYIGIHSVKTMNRVHEFIAHLQHELSFISGKAVITLQDVSELLTQVKGETRSLSEKSLLSLHELHGLISFLHDETKSLALKASNGIAKVTIGSLVIGALSQFLKKKKE
ncbi:hypothetical protein [Sulfuricurvum sp.]|uniref:hypothetical protein n=1 Tax=Sulfuricurvum sp. TaxID=2025608 RepID=UPI002E352595|nr:hypothetical protein [Sulfuricurvum sp.]HEX5330166.1 hypothetical protein [Sulfuricurvum sp.]